MTAAATQTAAPAEQACPKCRRSLGVDERACARCGLLSIHFARFCVPADPPELDAAWVACRAAWTDPSRHDRLIELAANLGALPSLARRYRELHDQLRDDPVAPRRLVQIATFIESSLRAQAASERSPASVRLLWWLGYLVAGSVLLASAWALVVVFRHPG